MFYCTEIIEFFGAIPYSIGIAVDSTRIEVAILKTDAASEMKTCSIVEEIGKPRRYFSRKVYRAFV